MNFYHAYYKRQYHDKQPVSGKTRITTIKELS